VPTFGFSAFLKMLSLSVRRQRSEMRARLSPSEGGYDFHRAFRRLAHRHLSEGEYLGQLLREAAAITNPAEARSATSALKYLEAWRFRNSGELVSFQPKIYDSPNGRFKVRYAPDFGVTIGGVRVAVHVWNTKRPDLDVRMAHAALSLIADLYDDGSGEQPDLAVLSIPDNRLIRLSDVPDQSVLAGRVVAAFEALIEEIDEEIRQAPSLPGADQPIFR
jgi:hypothetical protein